MPIKRYPEPTGGTTLETATPASGVAWPNINETQFFTFPTGSLGSLAPGDSVYLTDGTLKGSLVVVAIGADDEGYQTVEMSYTLQVGALGTTTATWGFAP